MYKFIAVTLAVVSVSLIAAKRADARGDCCCVRDAAPAPAAAPAAPRKADDAAQAPQTSRRYSYEPSFDEPSTRTYQPRSYSGGMRRRSSSPAWSLQKTDPGKYRAGR